MTQLNLNEIAFRAATKEDIEACFEIETDSYPEDEAASLESLQYRQKVAGAFFQVAYLNDSTPIGFVCGTLCKSFTHETMSKHDESAAILAIHSVVVKEEHRRKGIATAMLRHYVDRLAEEEQFATVEKVMLICKQHLLGFYVSVGFKAIGLSKISHGSSPWIECELDLLDTRNLSFWVVDSFADKIGRGNPAAVVMMSGNYGKQDDTSYEEWMQKVAAEFNLSETVFVSKSKATESNPDKTEAHFNLRYFSPTIEIEFCGHATLAAAQVLFDKGYVEMSKAIIFHIHSMEPLVATKSECGEKVKMKFPIQNPIVITDEHRLAYLKANIAAGIGLDEADIQQICDTDCQDVLVEISKACFQKMIPNTSMLANVKVGRGIIISAEGDCRQQLEGQIAGQFDFTSRFFAPGAGIDEDPVTGSAHCTLAPYYGKKLGKTSLHAWQDSKRGGSMLIEILPELGKLMLTCSAVISSYGKLCRD
mmetsp:Transcript_3625/g.4154  ORF Transcript_3625/g.4154 Transcript_3625/m.4154 type:complete len:478 (-) Transcript_3625:246-1679(-)|eukprot:CAMPEP_0184011458 /NCGR_PEP_ID=MMETSP0954-20121128/3841_1 /TAXON_ID=627963 /ORGANISM="Aplanochytrium sp, Strain PBS07" /LENGTH=477 /DNA_ID=CAMNT_0026291283 /DNA_START=99 /DNA_END=1532 /DNA_ORIENTATION=-